MINKRCNESWICAKGFDSRWTRCRSGDWDPCSSTIQGKLGKVGLQGPRSLLRVREGAGRVTPLWFTQQPRPLKHCRGRVSMETPPKHEHTEPVPRPSPPCLGKGCAPLGSLPGKGKPAAPAPAALPAAWALRMPLRPNGPRGRGDGVSVPVLQRPLCSPAVPGRGARLGAAASTHPPLSHMAMEQLRGWCCYKDARHCRGTRSQFSPAHGCLCPRGGSEPAQPGSCKNLPERTSRSSSSQSHCLPWQPQAPCLAFQTPSS